MGDENREEVPPLVMTTHPDGITFQTPNRGYTIDVAQMIVDEDRCGLLLWAIWTQLRDTHMATRAVHSTLEHIAKASATPAPQVQKLETVLENVTEELKRMGMAVPPGFDDMVARVTRGVD